ncbi:bifunctional [glutamate--ammonia ligase]-adenylyl-L-tyrosine phosphorylase/[glutamate--ammonia-ligase] adenylyltransferase [Hydrogenovibrio sp. JE_KL2]|uniref:bifunctional [glutamate--ammonia ligase]-adenylyl-L-tyrosine phosphorylase/[glutamate--ammonia-ligase] adenylyltransferase n=1 Tax=Hydrogenovibrio sp. JE_KL2 TaxID=2651188 RepID=UPI00128B886F|nr:bifunctional [glutamate--ammonia ligase]-adenylyl-L-tyrosine phosphorylase/[glutamate--ammonia-ligase] adenylyltransferase [Hydrogenovibrio sp. JE_KL2]MPQ77075.1 bifunctional [glutamate--ammonia ligase]-adenylyl-L-tyrosine phosphorylase/[glutamate--ammonia-ligase] adenylyltransferase [Hydrogenovibrio sp. JE_KL2]
MLNAQNKQEMMNQVKSWSLFVERTLSRFPEWIDLVNFESSYGEGGLVSKLHQSLVASADLTALNQTLRQHRLQEMLRIAVRDLGGLAPVEETLKDLSSLADGLVSGTLDWHYEDACKRYGTPIGQFSGEPQKMLVIGMGKLGGRELNFSSDIDLIFAYPEKGQAVNERGKETSNDQFFIRLGQALNKSLTEYTDLGMVYRVDMRLRPFGDSGPLAVSFNELENYYEIHGRAWERYALVKARIIAGDQAKGKELFDILRPFVFRKYVDFTAIESLRELKAMINAEVQKKDKQQNIKLGRGGIREVEFIVQAFQLVHGGKNLDLQGRELLPMLDQLTGNQFIDSATASGLKQAYLFLRKAENRLQEWNDQQTHDLPQEVSQQLALAEAMGYPTYVEFMSALEEQLSFVQQEFDLLFADQDAEGEESIESVGGEEGHQQANPSLEESLSHILEQFKKERSYIHASSESLQRFQKVLPRILNGLKQVDNPEITLERVLKVVESIMKRSVYFVLLKENVGVIDNLLKLCSLSEWMTDMLSRYPALLDQLLDPRVLYEPLELEELKKEAYHLLEQSQDDEEMFMNQMRQWRHEKVFRVAAADVTGQVPVMKVSDYLTWIAEAAVEVVTEYAWRHMQKRNGFPGGYDSTQGMPFLILGYGKLGGIELGYGSDLDMVFLYYGLNSSDKSDGERGLENNVYFIRMGQKIISLMTTMMPTGTLYEVDTRLRPNGASGLLVTSFENFMTYEESKAWVWEHQALVRVRPVVGSQQAKQGFEAFKRAFIAKQRDLGVLKKEVVDMRQKMQQSLDKSSDETFDLKQGRGGIVDIEFMVQYLVLGFACQHEELTVWSDNVRLLEAVRTAKVLDDGDVQLLEDAYRAYRKAYHRLALQNVKAIVPVTEFQDERKEVTRIWNSLMLER